MRMHNGEERLPCHSEPKGRFDPDRPHKKEWRTSMEIECLTPEFPQGARVYSSDGIESSTRNFGEYPSAGEEYMLSAILVENPPEWSFLSEKALNGILTRASRRGGEVAGLTADCYSWHDRMVASKTSGGGQQHIP